MDEIDLWCGNSVSYPRPDEKAVGPDEDNFISN